MNYIENINIRKYKIEYTEKCPRFSNCNLLDVIPENVCPVLLHTSVPYYITYLHGGSFTWSREFGHVDIQCPNPKGGIVADIVNNESIFLTLKSSKDSCPMQYKVGLKINLLGIFDVLCPFVYDIVFPWILRGVTDSVVLRCPGCTESRGLKFILKQDYENK